MCGWLAQERPGFTSPLTAYCRVQTPSDLHGVLANTTPATLLSTIEGSGVSIGWSAADVGAFVDSECGYMSAVGRSGGVWVPSGDAAGAGASPPPTRAPVASRPRR